MTVLYTCRQTKTEDLERENDKADMQMKDHMLLKVERRLKREREIEKEGGRRGGRGEEQRE